MLTNRTSPPTYLLTADNPHASTLLRNLAARVRATNHEEANKIDAEAARFDAWRKEHKRR